VTGLSYTSNASGSVSSNIISQAGTGILVDDYAKASIGSNNNAYDNTVGIRFGTNGTGSVTGNDFNGGAYPRNSTDLRIANDAGSVTIGAGNAFAGDTYFIDNQSTQTFDLTGANAQTYEGEVPTTRTLNPAVLADDFRIEDYMYHGPDNGTSGV